MSRADGFIGWAGGIIDLATLILFIWGVVRAFKMSAEPLPLVGGFQIL